MRRILSIAICSVLAAPAWASWTVPQSWDCSTLTSTAESKSMGDPFQLTEGDPGRWVRPVMLYSAGWRIALFTSFSGSNPDPGSMNIPWTYIGNFASPCDVEPGGVVSYNSYTPPPDPTPTPTPTPPPEEEFEFEYTFGAELGGAVVQIRDAQGNVIGSWTVPIGGGTVAGSVSAADLTDAMWFVDGLEVGLIDDPAMVPNQGLVRPSFEFSFDDSYAGGEWKIERSDGSLGAIGPVGSGASVGKVTIGQGDTATVWTRVPAGDGNGGAWIPTTVSLSTGQPVVYSFANNPQQPAPNPFPTPPSLSNPTPAPSPPAALTNSPVTVSTNVPAPTNDVSVNVEPLTLEDADDGEQQVLDGVGELSQLVVGIVSDMRTAQTNIIASGAAFSELRLGGVGKNCTFQFGPASITLQTSEPVRAGLKLLILGIGAFAAAAMIRGAVQS